MASKLSKTFGTAGVKESFTNILRKKGILERERERTSSLLINQKRNENHDSSKMTDLLN